MSGVFPLSTAQQRLWLADQAQSGQSAYHICRVVDFGSDANVPALRQALGDVLAHHEALRLAIAALDGQPLQRVEPSAEVELPVLQLDTEQESRVRAVDAAQRPFDLTRGRLLRAELHRLPGADRLVLVLHHIAADAWSVDLVLQDLRNAYQARSVGNRPDWMTRPSYRDFIARERAWLDGPECLGQIAYWDEQLAGLDAVAPRRSRQGAMLPFSVPAGQAEDMRGYARDNGLTLAALCLAGFGAVLHRWTSGDELVIGVPFANRTDGAWAHTVGLFVNTVPIRLRFHGEPRLRLVAVQARERMLEALTHSGVPLDRVTSPTAFDVVFSLLPGSVVDGSAERIYAGRAKFELSLELIDHGPGRELSAQLEYDTDVYPATSARQLAQAIVSMLSTMDARVGAAKLTDEPAFAGTHTRSDRRVDELFAEVACANPDRAALIDADSGTTLTYRELSGRMAAFAGGLAANGVGRGDRVGLVMPRGTDLVIAILGTLAAGAAYVPLDPEYPLARMRELVAAAGIGLVVTDLADVLGDHATPQGSGVADDPAYVMFTSGSTGTPKGVVVPHRAIVRLVRGADFAPMTTDERWLHVSAPAFDASTLELWAALLNGGSLVVLGGSPSAARIGAVIGKYAVTNAWFTAGLFSVLVDEDISALRPLRTVLTGGDVVSPEHARRVLRLGLTVVNGYGPTENTTFTTCHVMRDAGDVSEPLPIGRPINGTTVAIVDRYLQPVPIGVPGEILAGGAGLALGYAGRPALTAKVFVPAPDGQRRYRTGDRGYLAADGIVHFLGRQDDQAKVRGYRVEPGEIETALLALPGVQQCAVAARDSRLIGYVVGEAAPEELMEQLSVTLPSYLVPRQWVRLAELPLGPTGKVDRRALPLPLSPDVTQATPAEPRSVIEQLIVAWAADLLGISATLDTDLFAAGAHSLLASRLAARIRATFQVDLPLATVFGTPRLGDLAAEVAALPRAELPELAPGPRDVLSPAQERMLFLHQFTGGGAEYHMPLSVRLTGPLDVARWEQRLRSLVDRHPVLRTVFSPIRVLEGDRLLLATEDLSLLPPDLRQAALAEVASATFHRPFDLTAELPLRATLVKLDTEEHELLLCVHHIAADGASVMLMLSELVARSPRKYEVEYADYARWQRAVLDGVRGQRLAEYWRAQLAEAPQRLALAPAPARLHTRGALHRVRLERELAVPIRALARANGATMYATLLTAFAVVLTKRTGKRDLLIGTPVDNREHAALSDVVGLFLNTLPIRCRVAGTFAESLQAVKRSSVEALAHAGLPFERIVELAGATRELGEHPLVQVMFAVQPAIVDRMRCDDVEVRITGAHHGTAKCDLTISLFDDGSELTGFIEYRTDRFDATDAVGIWDQFLAVLRDPDLPIEAGVPIAAPQPAAPATRKTADVGGIAEIWAEVLEVAPPEADDDFFALGGHSLAAVRLVARIREQLGKEVPLRAVFEAPTLGAFAAMVRDAPQAVRRVPIVARPDLTIAPLSPAQQRHWVINQLEPESAAQNVPLVLKFRGPVDTAALERAFTTVAVRHTILRTSFEVCDGVPVQVVAPAKPIELAAAPWTGPFNLAEAPPWHVAYLPRERELHLTLHHILTDGWSLSVLLHEIAAVYQGNSLTPLPIQYADHARHLAANTSNVDVDWWRDRLAGVPMLDLPTDRPRGAEPSYRGAEQVVTIGAARRAALESVARAHHGTLFTAIYAVFATMLGRYSGQEDFAIGTFHAGRNDPVTEPLIGFFVNNVALRADLRGDPTWAELLARLSAAVTADFEHAEVPFERVVEALRVPRSLRQTPVFSAMCVLQNLPTLPTSLAGVEMKLVRRPYERADFDLTLWLRETGDGGLAGAFSYDADLFEGPTVARLAVMFSELLGACLEHTNGRVALAARGEPPALLARLTARAALAPEATALLWPSGSMSYHDLWARAGLLAAQLRARGVGPETRVGVRMRRSPEAVIAFLGVLRAGGAYVPIDPAYPESYQRHCSFVLDELPEGEAAGGEPAAWHPEQLAYAIFTSGSTGQPKAVLVSRANLDSYLAGIEPALALSPTDRVLNFASIGFDATTEELYPALLAGAAVVLRPPGLDLPGEEWDEFLAATTPTVLSLPVAFWQAWVERLAAEGQMVPAHVHTLLLNAEEPSARHYAQWVRAGGGRVRFVNTYGPTEATVTATLYEPGDDVTLWQRFPIGKRLSNMDTLLADRGGLPVPDGAAGQLCLGGPAVTRGYLGRAGLTAAAYRPADAGQRWYQTGDLARLLPSGELLLLGRADRQVKIRGYRVELGGIEAVLTGHPDIRSASVLARERARSRELVAYVATELSEVDIRAHLATRLPGHAVPAHVHVLTELPLTPNRKVDRAALALIEPMAGVPIESEPLSPNEAKLAGIWREVLGREAGRHDNFFAIGGDSIRGLQIVMRARSAGLALVARDLFVHQTIAEQALAAAPAELPAPIPAQRIPANLTDRQLGRALDRIKRGETR